MDANGLHLQTYYCIYGYNYLLTVNYLLLRAYLSYPTRLRTRIRTSAPLQIQVRRFDDQYEGVACVILVFPIYCHVRAIAAPPARRSSNVPYLCDGLI